MRIFMLLLAVLGFWPASIEAADFTNCSGQSTNRRVVGRYQKLCYELAAAESTDSGPFVLNASSGLICLLSDTTADAVGATRVNPRICVSGKKPAANPEFECLSILDAALDGTPGASGTQNACVRVGPGVYYLEVTAAPAVGEAGLISIQAESQD